MPLFNPQSGSADASNGFTELLNLSTDTVPAQFEGQWNFQTGVIDVSAYTVVEIKLFLIAPYDNSTASSEMPQLRLNSTTTGYYQSVMTDWGSDTTWNNTQAGFRFSRTVGMGWLTADGTLDLTPTRNSFKASSVAGAGNNPTRGSVITGSWSPNNLQRVNTIEIAGTNNTLDLYVGEGSKLIIRAK